MRLWRNTAFVLALARVTTRAYGSLSPAIAAQYAGHINTHNSTVSSLDAAYRKALFAFLFLVLTVHH